MSTLKAAGEIVRLCDLPPAELEREHLDLRVRRLFAPAGCARRRRLDVAFAQAGCVIAARSADLRALAAAAELGDRAAAAGLYDYLLEAGLNPAAAGISFPAT